MELFACPEMFQNTAEPSSKGSPLEAALLDAGRGPRSIHLNIGPVAPIKKEE